jgi:hypothetical protein
MMAAMLSDTHPDAERVRIDRLRRLSGAQKVSQLRSLSALVIGLSRRAIARANPGLDQRDVDGLNTLTAGTWPRGCATTAGNRHKGTTWIAAICI